MGINDAVFARVGLDVLTQFGDSATYTPVVGDPVTLCTVHLDTEVESSPDGYSVQARGAELTIEALIAEIGNDISIRRPSGSGYAVADRFTVGSDVYEVTEVLEEDTVFILMAVRMV